MGILRDTYIENKIDVMPLVWAKDRETELKKEIFESEKATKDRVNISLNEYENLKQDLETTKELLKVYQNFINDLSKKIQIEPTRLLKYKLVNTEYERVPMTMKNHLFLVFEVEDKDI